MTVERPTVLVLVQSPVVGDARVVREARSLAAAGYRVVVVGRGVPDGAEDVLPGVEVHDAGRSRGLSPGEPSTRPARPVRPAGQVRPASQAARRGLFPAARWLLLPEHRALVEARWRRSAARLVADLWRGARTGPVAVHAHDRNTLALATTLARRWHASLVYDAHELWSDRTPAGRPAPVRERVATRREMRRARRADAVLTVSDGIADVLRGRGVRDVVVVRNTFPLGADGAAAAPAPAPDHPRLVYAGRIGRGRDLETLVAAAGQGCDVLLVGPVEPGHPDATGPGVLQLPARPVEELDALYRENGIAAITLDASCRNHELALPNKLFHAVRAGVPVVAADLPEIRRVVTEHGLGALYRPGDATSLATAARTVLAGHDRFRAAVATARGALSWEHDESTLLQVYRSLRPPASRPDAPAPAP
ncbi:glycosyltransferase [Aquipuribacter sp. MA13-6]|uniref:glycosyltransferase n=1 Tax=unclassified Aquipuribacter TaxID=2635084 RepID=UPI003EEA41BB